MVYGHASFLFLGARKQKDKTNMAENVMVANFIVKVNFFAKN